MTVLHTGSGTFLARHAFSRNDAQHLAVGQRVRIRFYLGHLSGDHDGWVDGTQEPLLAGTPFTAEQEERTRRASALRPVKRGMSRYSLSSLLRCRHWGVTVAHWTGQGSWLRLLPTQAKAKTASQHQRQRLSRLTAIGLATPDALTARTP
jgi:hypothetical protein